MKKKLAIAALVILGLGTTAAVLHAGSLTGHIHDEGILANFRCFFCKGTGFTPGTNFTCSICKGRGHDGSY